MRSTLRRIVCGIIGTILSTAIAFADISDKDHPFVFPNDATPRLTHLNLVRGFAPLTRYLSGDSIPNTSAISIPADCSCTVTMRCRMSTCAPWSILLDDMRGRTGRITFEQKDVEYGGFQVPAVCMTVAMRTPDGEELLESLNITEGVGFAGDENQISLTIEREPLSLITIRGGNVLMRELSEIEIPDFVPVAFSLGMSKKGMLTLDEVTVEQRPAPWIRSTELRSEIMDIDRIDSIITSASDDITGYWTVLDRNFNESLIRLGGSYRLAIIPAGCSGGGVDEYDIHYISGASVNSGQWVPGELKGRISKSQTPGVWDIKWLDASHLPLYKNVEGQFEGGVLNLSFPYQTSSLRLQRSPGRF